jgi:hypothetical protein
MYLTMRLLCPRNKFRVFERPCEFGGDQFQFSISIVSQESSIPEGQLDFRPMESVGMFLIIVLWFTVLEVELFLHVCTVLTILYQSTRA